MDAPLMLRTYIRRRWQTLLSSYQFNRVCTELQEICRRNRIAMSTLPPDLGHCYGAERPRFQGIRGGGKRSFDIVFALVGLISLLPVFVVVAVAVKLESSGPIFIKQRRSLGRGSTPFDFYRFRTVYVGEQTGRRLSSLPVSSENTVGTTRKDDSGVTRSGRLIRVLGFDELPQLLNVLKGEMSLVGPRPLPVNDYRFIVREDQFDRFMSQRTLAKPGVTGLWQISGRPDNGFREMVLLDLRYIENQSLLYDLKILVLTVPVVLFGKGVRATRQTSDALVCTRARTK